MWKKIIIHHTASPTEVLRKGKWVKVNRGIIDEWHKRRGFGQIGYHFLVLKDGTVEAGRPINMVGAHCLASRRNHLGVGIALVGNFQESRVPNLQLAAAAQLTSKLINLFKMNGTQYIELHREVPGAKTLCPGRFFPKEEFIRIINKPVKITFPKTLTRLREV
ncbi:MAG: hypothetical protein DDT42_01248 [candidate division WS2 bacterium]|uniref:Peptidoglycan recognition protein family domain-containing protein n=1 Tax=Psychracetigena formicireducens TaxID=2986056 RepID=A0A9E2F275_PSYF1|nr:hypothetical protein [Candidatus Psychracetigena formicireducens]